MNQSIKTINEENQDQASEETQARIELAAVYRLIDYFGWSDLTLTHASTRVPNSKDHFLLNPFGIKFNHIKASDLIEVDLEGNILENKTPYINGTAIKIDSPIYRARDDINTIIHAHTPYGKALSTLECGLLYLDQAAMIFYDKIAYYDYQGLAVDIQEGKTMAADLGKDKFCLILRNHGLLICGRSIEEAFIYLYLLEFACKTQILAMSTGAKLIQPSPEILSSFSKQAEKFKKKTQSQSKQGNIRYQSFKALMRKMARLDPSYRD